MSRENVERVYATLAAIARGDLDGFLAHLAPDVTITPLYAELEGTVHHGRDGALACLSNLPSVFSGYGPKVESVRDLGESTIVKVQQQGQGAGSGASIAATIWVVVQWSGGKAIAWRSYREERQALEAVGLSE
jgi:ketosteroid isomerase-like protein